MITQLPTPGYESAHEKWLAQNPEEFRKRFRVGAPREFYASRYWKLVRQATLERDSFKCFRCSKNAVQVHHLHYEFMGEDHLHPETLVSICLDCHSVVEYGRHAEALVPVIRRRIRSCKGFAEHKPGFQDQTPVKVFARLLEYRDKLADLRSLFEARTPYTNSRLGVANENDPWRTPLSLHNKRVQD
jgi:hypothetical protein